MQKILAISVLLCLSTVSHGFRSEIDCDLREAAESLGFVPLDQSTNTNIVNAIDLLEGAAKERFERWPKLSLTFLISLASANKAEPEFLATTYSDLVNQFESIEYVGRLLDISILAQRFTRLLIGQQSISRRAAAAFGIHSARTHLDFRGDFQPEIEKGLQATYAPSRDEAWPEGETVASKIADINKALEDVRYVISNIPTRGGALQALNSAGAFAEDVRPIAADLLFLSYRGSETQRRRYSEQLLALKSTVVELNESIQSRSQSILQQLGENKRRLHITLNSLELSERLIGGGLEIERNRLQWRG